MKWSTTSSVLLGILVASIGVTAFISSKLEQRNTETQLILLNEIKQIRADSLRTMRELLDAHKTNAESIVSELETIQRSVSNQEKAIRAIGAAQAPQQPRAAQNVTLPIRDTEFLGKEKAPITVVEFVDYQCPFCKRFYDQTFDKLKENFIDTGKVRFISRNLPLAFHGQAKDAAKAAHCAGEQKKFWQMRKTLMDNARDLSQESITKYAKENKLNIKKFDKCVSGNKYSALVEQDLSDASEAGITGTPSFVIGRETKDGIEGIKVVGAMPYQVFEKEINKLLEEN